MSALRLLLLNPLTDTLFSRFCDKRQLQRSDQVIQGQKAYRLHKLAGTGNRLLKNSETDVALPDPAHNLTLISNN